MVAFFTLRFNYLLAKKHHLNSHILICGKRPLTYTLLVKLKIKSTNRIAEIGTNQLLGTFVYCLQAFNSRDRHTQSLCCFSN